MVAYGHVKKKLWVIPRYGMKSPMDTDFTPPERRIYTVTELTQKIKRFLEEAYPFVWVSGEISNLRIPVSGHYYFTLKDAGAQIRVVMFRAQNRNLAFQPEDGMAVIAMGRLNVYEPRGVYQVIVEYLEPEGIGVLQLAFEQLRARLAQEGLFDEKRKRPLPFLPQKIAVVTSPTGAVVRDIIQVIDRRFPNVAVQIVPVRVQGEGAAQEIAEALQLLNQQDDVGVVIVARGGGSLEDLQAFNSEMVARAIFSSKVPVVSAVGHETDFTIADFTADLRAPTPSAAAEIIVPVKHELLRRIGEMRSALKVAIVQRLRFMAEQSVQLSRRLVHPRKIIVDYRLRLDDILARAVQGFHRQLRENTDRLGMIRQRLVRCSPLILIEDLNILLKHYHQTLLSKMEFYLELRNTTLRAAAGKLDALSPLAVLERGFSITRALPGHAIVKDVGHVELGQQVEVTVSRGEMVCRVERKQKNGEANL